MIAPATYFAFFALGSFSAALPDGSKVTLLTVSDDPAKRAWSPNGSPAKPISPTIGWPIVPPGKGDLAFYIQLDLKSASHIADPARDAWLPSVETTPPLQNDRGIHVVPHAVRATQWVVLRDAHVPGQASVMDLALKVAVGTFKTAVVAKFSNGAKTSGGNFIKGATIVDAGHGRKYEAFPVDPSHYAGAYDYRYVAVDNKHNALYNPGVIHLRAGTYMVFERDPKSIAEVQLQLRPFATVRFTGIRTRPTR